MLKQWENAYDFILRGAPQQSAVHQRKAPVLVAKYFAQRKAAADRRNLCRALPAIVNVVSCALWSGALCEKLPRFDANAVWERIANGGLTLFMTVPTIYMKLISAWEPRRRAQESGDCPKNLAIDAEAAYHDRRLRRRAFRTKLVHGARRSDSE